MYRKSNVTIKVKIVCYVLCIIRSAVDATLEVAGDVELEILRGQSTTWAPRGFRGQAHQGQGQSMQELLPRCSYRYPAQEQLDVLLTDMMNQMTKVFLRGHELLSDDLRRKTGVRFIDTHESHAGFFERIFDNMTQEYQKVYRKSKTRVEQSQNSSDPCSQQEALAREWRDLLECSLGSFRRAAHACLAQHLAAAGLEEDPRLHAHLGEFLLRELDTLLHGQLHMLCDTYQMCFNDLR